MAAPHSPPSRRPSLLLVGAAVLLLMVMGALLLYWWRHIPARGDEFAAYTQAMMPAADLAQAIRAGLSIGYAHAFSQHFFFQLFGASLAGLRFAAALPLLMALAVVSIRCNKSWQARLLHFALVSALCASSGIGRFALTDGQAYGWLAACSVMLLISLEARPRAGMYWLAGIISLLGMLAHPLMLLSILMAFSARMPAFTRRHAVTVASLCGAACVAWFFFFRPALQSSEQLSILRLAGQYPFSLAALAGYGRGLVRLLFSDIPGLLLAVPFAVYFFTKKRKQAETSALRRAGYIAGAVLLIMGISAAVGPAPRPFPYRYLVPVYFFLLFQVSRGDIVWLAINRKAIVLAITAVCVALLLYGPRSRSVTVSPTAPPGGAYKDAGNYDALREYGRAWIGAGSPEARAQLFYFYDDAEPGRRAYMLLWRRYCPQLNMRPMAAGQ